VTACCSCHAIYADCTVNCTANLHHCCSGLLPDLSTGCSKPPAHGQVQKVLIYSLNGLRHPAIPCQLINSDHLNKDLRFPKPGGPPTSSKVPGRMVVCVSMNCIPVATASLAWRAKNCAAVSSGVTHLSSAQVHRSSAPLSRIRFFNSIV